MKTIYWGCPTCGKDHEKKEDKYWDLFHCSCGYVFCDCGHSNCKDNQNERPMIESLQERLDSYAI